MCNVATYLVRHETQFYSPSRRSSKSVALFARDCQSFQRQVVLWRPNHDILHTEHTSFEADSEGYLKQGWHEANILTD